MSLTPHGPGFSFLDKIEIAADAQSARGEKYLAAAAPYFRDHFPGNPLMPGVLLIECAAQTAGALWKKPQAFLAGVTGFRFTKPVRPGQTVETTVVLERDFGGLALFSAELQVAGKIVVSGKITLSAKLEGHAPSWPNAVGADADATERVPPRPVRKIPIHVAPVSQHNRAVILFVTVCTAKRKRILAKEDVHRLLVESWRSADAWTVGRYVIMPDHVHLFCSPNSVEPMAVEKWVKYWKTLASRGWPRAAELPVWQKSFWDTQLRRGDSYENKWDYVRANPVRHGLVKRREEWAYQGELNVLDWHD